MVMRPVEELRSETPGCAEVVHFNNAGSALPPATVVDRVIDHVKLEAAIGGYEAAASVSDELNGVHGSLAALIGAGDDEIAVVDSATRAWLAAFTAIRLKSGDRVLAAKAEYSSNIIALRAAAEQTGATIEVVPNDPDTGELSVEGLSNMMDDDVRLVAVTHAPTNGGLLQPIEEIGAIVRSSPALLLLDACQSVGQVPIDVEEWGVDLLTATGRKYLRGPRGTGFLYARRDVIEGLHPVHIDLHSATVAKDSYLLHGDARRFELWEKNIAAVLGLKRAADYYSEVGIEDAWRRISSLAEELRQALSSVRNVDVLDLGRQKSGIVSFRVDGADPSDVADRLRERRINVTTSRWQSTPWEMRDRGIESVVRASVHYYNDEAELQALVEAVDSIAG